MPRKNPDVPTKTISLTCDHVHMPEDLLTPAWEDCNTTTKYVARQPDEKSRAKYLVHADLADFLIGRDQAVEVMPDEPVEG